jgi:ElaA protein
MSVTITQTRDIAACRALRRTVFIHEQGVPETDEVDDRDDDAIHLLLTEDGLPLGSARLLIGDGYVKIGRVCVLGSARGRGFGAALIQQAVAVARMIPGVSLVKLGAQTHATGFYAALGFAPIGPEFMDAGIAHQEMTLTL